MWPARPRPAPARPPRFLIALYNLLLTRPAPAGRTPTSVRALVVAPTRELAVQIHHDAEILGKFTGLRTAVVYGGTDYEKQRKQLTDGIDVLIGTPRSPHRLLQTARI